MRFLFASIVIAPLMLMGALPAAQSISSAPPFRLASGGDSTAGDATEDDLNAAWTKVEAVGHKLQIASAEDWVRARNSFEKASHELTKAWDKSGPDDK